MLRSEGWARRWRGVALVAALAAGPTFTLPVAPTPAPGVVGVATDLGRLRVGSVVLHRCAVVPGAWCGSVRRAWEPRHPAAGSVTVGFAFRPASDTGRAALGTLVPHEGGPGYSTTGTGTAYAAMYGPLLRRRNLLLVDQRGTGRSEPIDCPALQDLRIAYAAAAAACGARLGPRADDYATGRSADDLAAVVRALRLGAVDVYGDSYGTFFAQVFTGRHPGLVRSLVLDSAYPAYGERAWYPTQTPRMLRAFDVACGRSPACRRAGDPFLPTLRRVLRIVRAHPWHGTAHDADGRLVRVRLDAPALVDVAFGATFTPTFYRELTAALRSSLVGDRAPLRRLVAEATGGGTDAGPVVGYSEGLDAAVACHDYPQLYDMTAAPATRRQQYAAALVSRQTRVPGTYAPFTVAEYAASSWQELDWCTDWPAAPADHPARPPRPPAGRYPGVPVLVLSGELDSITTPAEGALVARQFPRARRVLVRNSFHVTAVGDTDDCAQRIVRSFVAAPGRAVPGHLRRCAEGIPPLRATGTFPYRLDDVRPARGPATLAARQVAGAVALTVADLPDRWWNNYSGHGAGLRGGRWTRSGGRVVTFGLHDVRFVRDLAVSGRAVWDRDAGTMTVRVTVSGTDPVPSGRLRGHWDTRRPHAVAVLTGRLGGQDVRVSLPAP